METNKQTGKIKLNLYQVVAWCVKKGCTQRLIGEYYGDNAADAMAAADRQLTRAKVQRVSGYICHKIDTIYID